MNKYIIGGICFAAGSFITYFLCKRKTRNKPRCGTIIVDKTEPNKPSIYLELGIEVDELIRRDFVEFSVISQK